MSRTKRQSQARPRPRIRIRRRRAAMTALAGLAVLALAGFGGQRVLAHRASSTTGGPASRCLPTQMNRSALLPGTTLTVSPLPDSYDASPYTQISFLGAAPSAIAGIGVSGSRTGSHDGRLIAYSQGDGASFVPSHPFAAGETVTVHGRVRRGRAVAHFAFRFTVSTPDPLPRPKSGPKSKGKAGDVRTFHSLPGVQAPSVWVTASSPAVAPGYVFTAPYSGPGQDGPMIFDGSGNLVWFHPLPLNTKATNLQVQSYEGRPVLTWWQGYIPPQGFGEGEEVVTDSSYRTLFHVHAGNGYTADLHDFHLMGQNTALLTVFNTIHCNLSSVGGPSGAALTDGVFQEVDLKTRLVRREWHSADHVSPSQSYSAASTATLEWPFDYFHINSIERRQGDGFLISSRNTSALYLLDPSTEQVTLQVGGKHPSVKMGSGTSTAYQHDAQELPNGEIAIFDNGGVPMVHSQSRGILVALDPKAKTTRLVAQYEHPTPLKAGSQGNIQALENGDFFVGWGPEPFVSEFAASGALVFDARMPHGTQSYRGYRFPWTATPAEAPAVAASVSKGVVTAYASWNGATIPFGWRVIGGPDVKRMTPLTIAAKQGFETAIAVPGKPAYVAVQALDAAGNVLSTSHPVKG
jgi:Arylsulfotransferase (ASST)